MKDAWKRSVVTFLFLAIAVPVHAELLNASYHSGQLLTLPNGTAPGVSANLRTGFSSGGAGNTGNNYIIEFTMPAGDIGSFSSVVLKLRIDREIQSSADPFGSGAPAFNTQLVGLGTNLATGDRLSKTGMTFQNDTTLGSTEGTLISGNVRTFINAGSGLDLAVNVDVTDYVNSLGLSGGDRVAFILRPDFQFNTGALPNAPGNYALTEWDAAVPQLEYTVIPEPVTLSFAVLGWCGAMMRKTR